jgi:23S rRNA pseudouridine955/2504/2580 synthase
MTPFGRRQARPGVAVHGGSGISYGLIEQLRAARPAARFLELAHRLDRDTSGVLLIAKQRPALVALHAALRSGDVDKRYQVLVRGRWRGRSAHRARTAAQVLDRRGERRVRVDTEGRASETVFRRLATCADTPASAGAARSRAQDRRTHQIRVHLAHIGFVLAAMRNTATLRGTRRYMPRACGACSCTRGR